MKKEDIVYALNYGHSFKNYTMEHSFKTLYKYIDSTVGLEVCLIKNNKNYFIVEKYKDCTANMKKYCCSWDKARMVKEFRDTIKFILS